MTLHVTMRRSSCDLQPQQHRWSISTDGKHVLTKNAPPSHIVRSKSCMNSGQSYRGRWSSDSSDSTVSTESECSFSRVVVIGENGVGKSALSGIFAGARDSMGSNCDLLGDDTYERTLDEGSWSQEQCMQAGDAYLIVYSITDRASFEKASELRIRLRRTRQSEDIPIILVGNKSDLVRRRQVSVTEGRACAVVFDCKFIETSAAVHHNVQEMFEGIVRQVRLRRDSKEVNEKRMAHYKRRESLPKKAKRFLDKIVAKNNKNMAYRLKSKSCHDLSVL
ncbi:GTP-binding protein GEM [Acipenser ruthenus]|uniref:GTP-binding protein n=1 Tax=Acipenser ruthenus TaxID=7906 RepID=A0A662YVI3_ACIRT|nr:GTP-binding protein GEM [Acipenser ruthenus]